MTFDELESENAKLRADLVACRAHFVTSATKLGTAAALAEFPADGSVQEISDAIRAWRLATYHRGFDAGEAEPDDLRAGAGSEDAALERGVKPDMRAHSAVDLRDRHTHGLCMATSTGSAAPHIYQTLRDSPRDEPRPVEKRVEARFGRSPF